ncbi:uncharacterized protein [Rutidosis leptorrhynchoides]|uniref:uncharacterized protein n=1 Tax=Rutidosis leptorrhynchoides TaxID=125765 RepID=UPI003A99CE47
MDCLVLPVTILRRRSMPPSRKGYRQLRHEGYDDPPVTVVVGKEKKEFLVEAFVLEEIPFQVLMSILEKKEEEEKINDVIKVNNNNKRKGFDHNKRVIYVDVDVILFEHMLWLMQNDCSSLFQLNLKEIIDFYALDN